MWCLRRMRRPTSTRCSLPHLAELGIVEQQVGELGALLDEAGPRQAGDLALEALGADQAAQHDAGVVEAERLVEVAGDEIAAGAERGVGWTYGSASERRACDYNRARIGRSPMVGRHGGHVDSDIPATAPEHRGRDRHMELTQLRAFRTVAETQSFTRAAERLNLTQSAVSRQIGALEHELGEPLFVRGRRVVRLTGFGEKTLSQVSRILDDLDGLAGQGTRGLERADRPGPRRRRRPRRSSTCSRRCSRRSCASTRASCCRSGRRRAPIRRWSTSSTAPSTSASRRGRWSRRRCR